MKLKDFEHLKSTYPWIGILAIYFGQRVFFLRKNAEYSLKVLSVTGLTDAKTTGEAHCGATVFEDLHMSSARLLFLTQIKYFLLATFYLFLLRTFFFKACHLHKIFY